VLVAEDLVVRYGGIEAVSGVSIRVNKGQVVSVLGANGAGKSSVMNCIAGLIKPERGRILLHGQPIHGRPAHEIVRHGIALVPEGRRIFPDFTVAENIRLAAWSVKRSRRRIANETLELFPALRTRLDQRGGALSGGEQQMLAIARALVTKPEVLLLDEPALGLAPFMVERVFEALNRIRKLGTTIVLVAQDVQDALAIADFVYVLRNGSVAAAGPPGEVSRRQDLVELYLGAG
jgi:branched-chain amino acid transport system ATP-binding protein